MNQPFPLSIIRHTVTLCQAKRDISAYRRHMVDNTAAWCYTGDVTVRATFRREGVILENVNIWNSRILPWDAEEPGSE